jgi:LL-diaminopimelate aminotransferase
MAEVSDRVRDLPPYLFAEIDRIVNEKICQGVDVIDFGIGDPDLPTPPHVVERLCREAADPSNHRYPSYQGMPEFREAAAAWMFRRFGVTMDPDKEMLALVGSKEGIAHFPITFLNPGDVALVPDPAYPVYQTATILCGAIPYYVPLRENRHYLPDLSAIPEEAWRKAKLFFINYPNNPTAAVADLGFFEELVQYCRKHEVILAHDNAYSEITYDGYVAPSVLEIPGAKEVTIEFHSLSKTYNMTGWRIGFCAGGEKIMEAFRRVKTNIDSGVFNAIQLAAISALEGTRSYLEETLKIYSRRREKLVNGLRNMGWEADMPKATLYVWMKVPEGYDSKGFTRELLERAGVVVAPGSAYGPNGEGYIRFSLTISDSRLEEGLQRIQGAFS